VNKFTYFSILEDFTPRVLPFSASLRKGRIRSKIRASSIFSLHLSMTAKDFLQTIIESLVDNTAAIQIEEKHDELGTLLSLRVDPADMGSIIGRGGKTIESLRTVIRVFGSKSGSRVNLRIIEDKPIE
jgi:uncharacterized protein